MARVNAEDPIAVGDGALARGAWEEARDAFRRALAAGESAEALEGLGTAAWWLDDEATTFDARERAYRLYAERGDRQSAARLAIAIAEDSLDFRGETAVANGWRERARRLLESLPAAPERGWLAIWEGQYALLADSDPATARRHAAEAIAIGRALDLPDIELLGRALEGLVLVSEGLVEEGMRRLDEATAAAVAGEMRDLVAVGVSCCYLVNACERVRDFDRAAQWCARVEEFCRRWHLQSLFAVCRTHYAAVLVWRGEWAEAEAELLAARRELAAVRPAMQGEGIVRLAELRRRQGRFEEAEELLREAEGAPLALLVAAALALDREDGLAAAELAERYLRGLGAEDRTERIPALDLLCRARLALGRWSEAETTAAALREATESVATAPIRATADWTDGCLSRAQGDLDRARGLLEDAIVAFRRYGAPYETALARLDLARVQADLGRRAAAGQEARLAVEALAELGALDAERRARILLHSLDETTPGPGGGLTRRELEVLRLVARGLTNAAIAERLGVSGFTVKRHVANLLTKLDLPTRAAAAAHAVRHGLV